MSDSACYLAQNLMPENHMVSFGILCPESEVPCSSEENNSLPTK